MNSSLFAGSRPRILMTLLASAAIATSGCSNMTSTASSGSAIAAAKVGGRIHGGNQPVSGATVNLYFAGTGPGLHSAATLAATTTSSNDGSGSFTFSKTTTSANDGTTASFSCPVPSSNNPYVFVVAKGGTTVNTEGATPNTNAEFIAPLGSCAEIDSTTNVYMSEVVTVATMAAIHQYLDPVAANTSPIEGTLGADGIFISTQALADSFGSVANVVSLSTGLGNTSITRAGLGVTMTITPELAKLNQLANILSACINQTTSGSAACQSIYSAAAPSGNPAASSASGTQQPVATDLLTALYYIFTNPTNGSSANMTTLYNLSAASGAPYQPTLAAMPSDWSIGVSYVASGSCSTSGAAFISNPTGITTGVSGNIFFTNNVAAGSHVEMNSLGVPIGCQAVPDAIGSVYDASGNTWAGSHSANTIMRYTGTLATSTVFNTAAPVVSITADGYGDVFFSATDGNLYEIVNGATAAAATVPVQINSQSIGTAAQILIDTQNRIYASSGSTFLTATQGTPSPIATPTSLAFDAASSTTQVAVGSASTGVAATSANAAGVYAVSSSASTIQALGGTVTPFTATSAAGGLNAPSSIALDGVQNVWAANGAGNSISAFDINGTALTPSTGFVKDASFLGPQSSISIDPSGNVWVGLANSSTITEILGAAVPVYQPYSNGLAPNTVRYGLIP